MNAGTQLSAAVKLQKWLPTFVGTTAKIERWGKNPRRVGTIALAQIGDSAKIGGMELFIRPAGTADAEEIAEVQRISWQATYARQLSPESLARVAVAWNAAHWLNALERTDDRTVSLVLDGPKTGIAGFGVAGRRRSGRDPVLRTYDGEIYLLYLLPAFQGSGHGLRLMAALARVLRARGMESALVWALATNRSAIGFYQRLSGSILMRAQKSFFGESVDEIALGWRDLRVLAGMSPLSRE